MQDRSTVSCAFATSGLVRVQTSCVAKMSAIETSRIASLTKRQVRICTCRHWLALPTERTRLLRADAIVLSAQSSQRQGMQVVRDQSDSSHVVAVG